MSAPVTLLPGPAGFFYVDVGDQISPSALSMLGVTKERRTRRLLLPARQGDVELLRSAGLDPVLPEASKDLLRGHRLSEWLQTAQEVDKPAAHPSWERLDPHQRVAVSFLASRSRALLSLSPGLGKSASAVVAAELMGHLPALVVAPLTLLPTWRDEIGKWGDPSIGAETANLRRGDAPSTWNLINPEGLHRLPDVRFRSLILDESVLYKSRSAKRTKDVKRLASSIPVTWLLSGSPTTRFADDLWAQLNILHPEWFSSYWRFASQWCLISATPWGDKISGNRNPAGLRGYLSDLMLSRTPAEVPVLPSAPVQNIKVELTKVQEKELRNAKENFRIAGQDLVGVLPQLLRMAQMVSYPRILGIDQEGGKMAALRELVTWAEPPIIVWCWFRETVAAVSEMLESKKLRVGAVAGDVPPAKREEFIDKFQGGELDVLVLQVATGKFGLSLTKAKTQVFYDRTFSLDDWIQAIARVRRRSSPAPVPTFVLDGGWTDTLIETALRRKLRSVTDLGVSDLLSLMT